jgi:hypothetical protein
MVLYARWLTLRNCGRFLHVASDFGSNYHTHPFLSQEMLYAGLTRERTREPYRFADAFGDYDFYRDFRVGDLPLWFSVGILVDQTGKLLPKSRQVADFNQFNSIRESTPTTKLRGPVPTYGNIESILPDNQFKTLTVSPAKEHLLAFTPGQVFWMGKKRTMFQTTDDLGPIVSGEQQHGDCLTPFIQVRPADSVRFTRMEVIAGTQRYVVIRGEVKDSDFYSFDFEHEGIGLPCFSLARFLEQIW